MCFLLGVFLGGITACNQQAEEAVNSHSLAGQKEITIPTIDISQDTSRHVIIAQGTENQRQYNLPVFL